MTNPTTVDQIADRVEHLLLRHEELHKTNALLQQQVLALSHERDLLKSKLAAARSRIECPDRALAAEHLYRRRDLSP
jgi:uncharacterized protein (TIGR02449 family)